jgi:hypothetical protein
VATDVCAPPFWSIKNSSIMPCEASGTDVPPCVNETGRRLGSSTVARRKRTKADWVTEHKILCQLERGPGEHGQGRRSSPSSIPFSFLLLHGRLSNGTGCRPARVPRPLAPCRTGTGYSSRLRMAPRARHHRQQSCIRTARAKSCLNGSKCKIHMGLLGGIFSLLIYTTSLARFLPTSSIAQHSSSQPLQEPHPTQPANNCRRDQKQSRQDVQLQRQVRGRRPDRRPPGAAAGWQPRRGGATRCARAQEVLLHAGLVRQRGADEADAGERRPRGGCLLSSAAHAGFFGRHAGDDKGGGEEPGYDEGFQEARRRATGGDVRGPGRVRAHRREHRGGAARARRAGAGAAQAADRALRPSRVLLPRRRKGRRGRHGSRATRRLAHGARREALQLHHAILR